MGIRWERWSVANTLPVLFVLTLIGIVWNIYVLRHIVPMMQTAYNRAVLELSIGGTLTLMLLINFGRAVFTDPGSVPREPRWLGTEADDQEPDRAATTTSAQSSDSLLPEVHEAKLSGARRWCKWCKNFKPDRCHHCRVCKSCVLRMDHHCPWIANCVGFRNHKYFTLLVIYAALDTHFVIITMAVSAGRAMTEETPFNVRCELIFGETLAVLLCLVVSCFLSFHVWLALRATTTIECCEKRWGMADPRRSRRSMFDVGTYRNIQAVLGPRFWLWWAPFDPPEGTGLSFAVSEEFNAAQRVRRTHGATGSDTDGSDAQSTHSRTPRKATDAVDGTSDATPEWTGPRSEAK